MHTARIILYAVCSVTAGVEWLAGGGRQKPLGPLAEELEDGVDPDGEHDGHNDDLIHVGNSH